MPRFSHENGMNLAEIRDRLCPSTLKWLQNNLQNEKESEETEGSNLFHDDVHDEEGTRVLEWTSSRDLADGVGGVYGSSVLENHEQARKAEGAVYVKYILSDTSAGHGADVWAASRHISNLMANPETCRKLLECGESDSHPLQGVSFVELGAGAGLPSWVAMKCGARIVCTDQQIPNRIQCLAESAERNWKDVQNESTDECIRSNSNLAKVCAYNWGTAIEDSGLGQLSPLSGFDVVVAADCIYVPFLHEKLLHSIGQLLKGVALLPFALHGNTDDDNVWAIVDRAKSAGFQVEILESKQLTPQMEQMDAKRALVHLIRLRKNVGPTANAYSG